MGGKASREAKPLRYGQLLDAIGVLEAPDNHMPIGMAFGTGRTEDGLKVWKPHVHGADVPGRWVIIDRQFVPVEGTPV